MMICVHCDRAASVEEVQRHHSVECPPCPGCGKGPAYLIEGAIRLMGTRGLYGDPTGPLVRDSIGIGSSSWTSENLRALADCLDRQDLCPSCQASWRRDGDQCAYCRAPRPEAESVKA